MSIPSTDLSRHINQAESSDDEGDNSHRLDIAEAFADDDVVKEFSQQRKRQSLYRHPLSLWSLNS